MKKLILSGFLALTLLSSVSLGAHTVYAVSVADSAAKAQQAVEDKPSTYSGSDGYSGISGWVMTQVMSLAAWLLGIAAITLNSTMYYTVVHMGAIVGGVDGLSAIGVVWRILRDIGNILLIFGFVALGITTILQVNWYGGGMQMLPKLLLAAVFINFSLFVSEAIIDTGNIFATQFYTQINGGTQAGSTLAGLSTLEAIQQEGISNKIMGQLGLQTMYGDVLTNPDILKGQNIWLVGAFGTILFLVAAFVFFSLAFVLIARFVILVLLIMVAPIGFAGLAVPKLTGLAERWWKTLFEQVITAPVLLLMLYVALAVITDAQFLRGFGGADTNQSSAGWLGLIGNSDGNVSLASTAGMTLSFLVAMGLLLAVIMMSKQLSAFGAGVATKWGGAASFGLVAFGARNSIGLGSQRLGQRLQKSKLGRIPVVGRSLAGALAYGANGSFDIRGTNLLKPTGLDAGTAQKGGFAADEKKGIEAREKYAKSLERTKKEEGLVKTEEGRNKSAEEMVGLIKAQNDEEKINLQSKHADDMRPFVNAVNLAQQTLLQAKKTGTNNEIAEAQRNLDAATGEQQAQRKIHAQEQEKLKEIHREMIDVQQKEVEERKKQLRTAQSAPQIGYAQGLTWGPGKINYRNTKAAANIIKNATKDKDQKNVDSLMDVLKKNSAGGEK